MDTVRFHRLLSAPIDGMPELTPLVGKQVQFVAVEAPPEAGVVSWEQFCMWARAEDEYQKKISGVHADDHADENLRGRSYFEVNVYRYFHALRVCWPYLARPVQKVMDVGSWPGAWLRAISHFTSAYQPQIWASGLMFPDNFMEIMGGACHGMQKIELDAWSPMADREVPNVFTERHFTFVSAMEVVEHLYHPGWMFQTVFRAMAPGGIFFMTTNNLARLQVLFGMLKGYGTAGNLDELLPRNGGILGSWRPHAREYTWRELAHLGGQAGFKLLDHGFYQENYGLHLIDGRDQPNDELVFANEEEQRFAEAVKPMLAEPDQLKSGIYVVFQKPGGS